MELDLDALQELPAEEELACSFTCTRTCSESCQSSCLDTGAA
ncbi:ALQxL family class IV lanthipeptide [Streptacidiphilus albus]|nr:ALQxL family class IV lanthipeptide [Streptacidiphilus albus]